MKRQPWIIYRYIGRDLAISFVMSLAALSLLFMIVLGIQAVQAGFKLTIVIEWILRSIVYSFYFTVPVSLLIASSLSYGRVAADREYTALCACGISPTILYMPMLGLSLLLTLAALATQGTWLPNAHYNQRNITRYLVKQLEHLGTGKEGRISIDQGQVFWDAHNGPNLRGVVIEKQLAVKRSQAMTNLPLGNGSEEESDETEMIQVTVTAEAAKVGVNQSGLDESINLSLINVGILAGNKSDGILFDEKNWAEFFHNIQVRRQEIQFPLNAKNRREGDTPTPDLLRQITEMENYIEKLSGPESALEPDELTHKAGLIDRDRKNILEAKAEIWERRALALSCFTFALLGFPFSMTLRYRHRLVSFFAGGMLVITTFYPLLLLGKTLAESGSVPAPIALLAGNIVLLVISAVFLGRLMLR